MTTVAHGQRDGCLVGFHAQCSIEPVRYAVWLSKANRTYRLAREAERLAVHFVPADEVEVARLFATTTGDEIDKFASCDWHPGPGGVPLLDRLGDRLVGRHLLLPDDGGDHVCAVVEPDAVSGRATFAPLRLHVATDWEAGHDAGDRLDR
ncbi:MAG TPA: flavin reductase family protein [Acidimicrobiales bacterium]